MHPIRFIFRLIPLVKDDAADYEIRCVHMFIDTKLRAQAWICTCGTHDKISCVSHALKHTKVCNLMT